MTLKDRIKELADSRNISLPALESALGFGNSTIVKWDKSTPNAAKLQAVADYFDVTMDYLMTGKEYATTDYIVNTPGVGETLIELNKRDERDIAKDLDRVMELLDSGEDGPVRFNGQQIDDNSRTLLRNAIELGLMQLKVENKELYNPNKNKK